MAKGFSLTDNDIMPYGINRNKYLKDVDSGYLKYIFENHDIKRYKGLKVYIKNRMEKESEQLKASQNHENKISILLQSK